MHIYVDNGSRDDGKEVLAQIGLVNSDNEFVMQQDMLARQTNGTLNHENKHARLVHNAASHSFFAAVMDENWFQI